MSPSSQSVTIFLTSSAVVPAPTRQLRLLWRDDVPPDAHVSVSWSGRDWFEEVLGGHTLRVRPQSFLQTNTAMANKLYERILKIAEPRADDIAYDLYCGLGSITLALAPHVQEVVGVEVVDEAIECAKENAELNGMTARKIIVVACIVNISL